MRSIETFHSKKRFFERKNRDFQNLENKSFSLKLPITMKNEKRRRRNEKNRRQRSADVTE